MKQEKISRVRQFMARPGVTALFMAHAAGVSRNHFNNAARDDWNPPTRALRKIVSAIEKLERLLPPTQGDAVQSREGG